MIKLDLKDKKLLYWLDQNSRATNKELGKKVGLTEQAIGYKLKRLQEEGVIKNFVTFINTLSLGYTHYKVFIKLQNTTEEIEQTLINSLVSNLNIRWVVSSSGKYDLSFSILAKTPEEFSQVYQKIESEFGKYISERNIVINIKSPGFTREFLIDGQQSKKLDYQASREIEEIDDVDKQILKEISQNARENIVDIAKKINKTTDIVKYRLKRLKERKIISGFTVQLDLEKLSYEYYSVFIHAQNLTKETENKIESFASFHPNVRFVVRTIGNHDLQLEIEANDYAELEKNLKEFRQVFANNIRDFEILRVIKEYKYDFYPF